MRNHSALSAILASVVCGAAYGCSVGGIFGFLVLPVYGLIPGAIMGTIGGGIGGLIGVFISGPVGYAAGGLVGGHLATGVELARLPYLLPIRTFADAWEFCIAVLAPLLGMLAGVAFGSSVKHHRLRLPLVGWFIRISERSNILRWKRIWRTLPGLALLGAWAFVEVRFAIVGDEVLKLESDHSAGTPVGG